jgi:hypothetical protein
MRTGEDERSGDDLGHHASGCGRKTKGMMMIVVMGGSGTVRLSPVLMHPVAADNSHQDD